MARAPSTKSGRVATVVRPISFGIVRLDEGFGALLEDGSRGLQPIRPGLGRVGLRARVIKRKRGYPFAKAAPEFKQDVSADGTTDERGLADGSGVKHAGNVRGVLGHESGALANFGITVAAEVGKNQAVARIERCG